MAIDLPPVIPPQAVAVAQLERYASNSGAVSVLAQLGQYRVRISGNRYLSPGQLEEILAGVETPAQAVSALNRAYYQLGHLLVTLYYAQQGNDVLVHVVNGHLDNLKAPPQIRRYFEPLLGDTDLERAEFDRYRVLANLTSDREQVDYRVSYQVGAQPESFTLVFNPKPNNTQAATEMALSANNFGNRFVGRYFANLSLKHDFRNGLQAALSYDRAMTEWGEVNGGDYYDGVKLKANAPTTLGLWGLDLGYVEYERDFEFGSGGQVGGGICSLALLCDLLGVAGIDLGNDGSTNAVLHSKDSSVAVTGEQVLASDLHYRFVLSQRLELIDNNISLEGFGTVLDEPQANLEIGGRFNHLSRVFALPAKMSAKLFAKVGLNEGGTLDSVPDEGQVTLGRRQGKFLMLRPSVSFQLGLRDWLNADLEWRGQYADGSQLPLQQQFFLGGSNGLSAYLPGILIGDSGHYTKFDFTAQGLQFAGVEIKPSVFVEYAEAWYENARGEAGVARALGDGGVGLSFKYREVLKSDFIAAAPLYDRNMSDDSLEESEVDFFWRLSLIF
jgi:hypothetical protein